MRDLLERITAGIGVRCRIDILEDDETVTASCSGSNLGLLIGKHGQTIDAIQYLANAIVWRSRPGRPQGRRRRTRPATGSGAARLSSRSRCEAPREALATHSAVELEPMTAVERKTVHLRLEGVRRRRDR